jgi:DNA-binding NarL/FixJ family response regulator
MLDGRSSIQVVAEVSDPDELPERPLDAVIFDYDFEALDAVLAACARESVALVVLGGEATLSSRLARLPVRGWALLARDASPDELAAGVHAASAGLIVLGGFAARAVQAMAGEPPSELDAALTAREREVLQAMAGGLANKQIAMRLGISVHTVKFHVAAILSKLDAASRTEAVSVGVRQGLVHL